MTTLPEPTAGPALVAIGGGGGVSQVLLGARPYFSRLTAAIAVTDTGRSTGAARAIGGIPAPGDLRNTLATLAAHPDDLLPRLMQHRLHTPGTPLLDGMAFGNLLLVALTQLTGDFAAAVAAASELLGTTARVLPVATADTQLCAELADGSQMVGELAVRGLGKPPIRGLYLAEPAAAHPPVLDAIVEADVVVLGPGSFYTSVLANLLFDGVVEALRQTRATVVFLCNTTTQPGQTDAMGLADHVARMVELLGPGVLDVALVNRTEGLDPELVARYVADGLRLLYPTDEELDRIAALGVRALVRDFAERADGRRQLWNKQDTIRHDPLLVGLALWKIAEDRALERGDA